MKKLILNLVIMMTLCYVVVSHAYSNADENNILHVYVTNSTHDKLTFDRVIKRKLGSNYTINPKMINPGETTVVTIEKLINSDIEGRVIFVNSNGDEASLFILDQEQVHFGQPIFNVSGHKFYSVLISKTRNKNVGPRYLTYLEANLKIVDKSEQAFYRGR